MKKSLIFIFALVFLILSMINVSAEINNSVPNNSTGAIKCIENSEQIMKKLAEYNFSVQSVNDSIKLARQIYDAQIIVEKRGANGDYGAVLKYCDDISKIEKLAYETRDEMYSLEMNYDDFIKKVKKISSNYSDITDLMTKARNEMSDERYKQLIIMIPNIEKKIIEKEAELARTNLFYRTVGRGIKEFLIDNWIKIFIIAAVLGVLFLIYRWKIRKYILLKKISRMEMEKKVIQELIKDLQRDYFEKGNVPEGTFNIKTKKYAEMVRDIERQIPLLREELAKVAAIMSKQKSIKSEGDSKKKEKLEKERARKEKKLKNKGKRFLFFKIKSKSKKSVKKRARRIRKKKRK